MLYEENRRDAFQPEICLDILAGLRVHVLRLVSLNRKRPGIHVV